MKYLLRTLLIPLTIVVTVVWMILSPIVIPVSGLQICYEFIVTGDADLDHTILDWYFETAFGGYFDWVEHISK